MRHTLLAAFLVATLWLTGCANYASRVRGPRSLFESGQYDTAIEQLKQLVERHDKDELLYLMDLGTAYHTAGKYKEAVETFLKAETQAELRDYTSVTTEVGTVIFSDEVKAYKGEDFEKILINIYLAMDYTLMGEWDEALVECRKVNHKLDIMINKGKEPYEWNAFAKYLAAILFEARREYNDAFVDYRTVLKWMPGFPYLPTGLMRTAEKLGAEQELEEYQKKFKGEKYRQKKGEGEVVLLLEQGRAPIKVPHPNFSLVPHFVRRGYFSDYGIIRDQKGSSKSRTYTLFDIEATAIKELDNRIAGITAKKIGGVVAKQIIANQVAKQTKSEGLGLLTALLLHGTDSADTRSWTTLPAHLQLARVSVPAGRLDLVLDSVSQTGTEEKGRKIWPQVEVKSGEMKFLNYRIGD